MMTFGGLSLLRNALGSSSQRLLGSVRLLQAKTASLFSLARETPNSADNKSKFLLGYESVDQLKDADESVRKIFDLEFASRNERNKFEIAKIIDKYKLREGDVGSREVQVAVLTLKVKQFTEHLQMHRKDKSCLRTLIKLLHRRRKLLLQLKEFRPNAYHYLLTELKLKPPVVTTIQFKKSSGKERHKRVKR